MAVDMLNQELVPGDIVICHEYSSLGLGVFVKFNGNYHIQICSHYYNAMDEQIVRWRDYLNGIMSDRKAYCPPVEWKQSRMKLVKINPSILPENMQELLSIVKETLFMKRKIRLV